MTTVEGLVKDLILGLVRSYLEIPVDQIVEYIWHNDEVEQYYDFPEAEVKKSLKQLEDEGRIEWDKERNLVRFAGDFISECRGPLTRSDDITKWEVYVVGSYGLPDDRQVDIRRIWDELKKQPITLGRKLNDPTPNFSEARGEIDFIWAFEAIRCACVWSNDRFTISSFMFKEPSQEILEYAVTQLDPMPDFVMKAIPFTGTYILYSHMRRVVSTVYPDVTFRLTRIGESRIKEKSFH